MWVLYCFGYGSFGDCVKDYVRYRGVFFNGVMFVQSFFQVLRNCFFFVIGVGCEDQVIVFFQCVCDGFDMFVVVVFDFLSYCEIVVGVD